MPTRSRRPPTAAFVGLILATLVELSCSRDGQRSPAPVPVPPAFTHVHAAVCDSYRAAEAGDSATAEARFADAHGGLHELAAVVQAEDRALAARLLEAKEKVEAGGGPDERRVLVLTAGEAIGAAGGMAPKGCAG